MQTLTAPLPARRLRKAEPPHASESLIKDRLCPECGKHNWFHTFSRTGSEFRTCRHCLHMEITFMWKEFGAIDATQEARRLGYKLPLPVLYFEGHVITYGCRSWSDFIQSCRDGDYAPGGAYDNVSWQLDARRYALSLLGRKEEEVPVYIKKTAPEAILKAIAINDRLGYEQIRAHVVTLQPEV
jgi:hypothetical protein